MSTEIVVSQASGPLLNAPEAPRAESDTHLVELWLHGRSPHTQRAYRADVERFFGSLLTPSLAKVTLADLQAFAGGELGQLSPATRYRSLSAVKSLLAFGHRIGYLVFDVGRVLRLPAIRDRISERILPEADLYSILGMESQPRNRAILGLLYASGCRVSEICDLRWRDLQPNGDGGQITVFGKGGKTRAIQVPLSIWKHVMALRDPNWSPADPVFASRTKTRGGMLTTSAVLRIVRSASRKAGIELPVSPHWFRHAHASHALDRGAPIHLVQATLGHASVATTGRYLHARPKESSGRYLGL